MRYKTIPKQVDAVQFTGDNFDEIQELVGLKFDRIAEEDRPYSDDPDATAQLLESEHGTWVLVYLGDYVVRFDDAYVLRLSREEFEENFAPVVYPHTVIMSDTGEQLDASVFNWENEGGNGLHR